MRYFIALLSLPIILCSGALHASSMHLIVPDFRPFTYYEAGQFQGIGVNKVSRIMADIQLSYQLKLVPNYGRAVEELKKGRTDGMFLASENAERNQVAVFSAPVVVNRWSWFVRKDSALQPGTETFINTATVATHLNTNTHKWLLKEGYQVEFTPTDINLLPKVLINRRVDAVFLAEEVFLKSSESLGISQDAFTQVVEIAKPFGIYIHKDYLQANPGFMDKLNTAIEKYAE